MLTLDDLKLYIQETKKSTELVKDQTLDEIRPELEKASIKVAERFLRGNFEEISASGIAKTLLHFYDDQNTPEKTTPDNFRITNFDMKYGIDPTKPGAHMGHLQLPFRLREWQDKGADLYLLLGTATAMLGDPTGEDKDRPGLTLEETTNNAKELLRDIMPALDPEKTHIVQNHEWYNQMTTEAFDYLCKNFPLSSLMKRKKFNEREQLSGGSFLYPTLQAFDSVMLNSVMGAGGKDQELNELGGRDSQKALGFEDQMVYLAPLVLGTDSIPGQKMSKSKGNTVLLKDPLDTYATLFESMQKHPDLINEFGEQYTNVSIPSDISSDDIKKYAKKVAESILISYFDGRKESNIAKKAMKLYEERVDESGVLKPELHTSGLKVEGLDELVNNMLEKREKPVHKFIDSLKQKPTKSISRGNLDKIEGFWDDSQLKQYEESHEKTAVAYFDVNHDKLHLGQIALLDKLYEMQTKEGYHIKLIFGNYTSGSVKFKSLGLDTATENADKIIKQITEHNLLDLEKITFHKNSDTYQNLTVTSLLKIVSQFNLRELADEGLININPQKYDRHINEEAPNTLELQYDMRKAMDIMLLGVEGDNSVIVDSGRKSHSYDIAEKLYKKIGLKAPKRESITSIKSKPDQVMGSNKDDSIIYVNGNSNDLYSQIMTTHDDLFESYSKLGLNELSITIREENTGKYLRTLDEATSKIIGSKMDMARSIVQRFSGDAAALEAERAYTSSRMTSSAKETIVQSGEYDLLKTLQQYVREDLTQSIYRGMIKQGAIKINGVPIKDPRELLNVEPGKPYELIAGKKFKAVVKGE